MRKWTPIAVFLLLAACAAESGGASGGTTLAGPNDVAAGAVAAMPAGTAGAPGPVPVGEEGAVPLGAGPAADPGAPPSSDAGMSVGIKTPGAGAGPANTTGQSATGPHVDHAVAETVRFIAVGDTGTGDANQLAVAQVMADTCARDGCDFVVLLGDNIYDQGPTAIDDPQWQLKFETPYAALEVPFYVVLGNHDVAAEPLFGSGYVAEQSVLEVEYAQQSSKWMMPAPHYTLSAGPVGLLMLDTTSLYNHVATHGDQHAWVGPARDMLQAEHAWVLSAGHHTYVSNGDHGNAGAYAYFDFDPGVEIKEFFEINLCGAIDVVLTGHDHNRQWIDPSMCAGTDVIVSGAGAKVRGLPGGNPAHWQSDTLGFLYVVADAHALTGKFIGLDGSVDFERTLTK